MMKHIVRCVLAVLVAATSVRSADTVPPVGDPAPKLEPHQRWVFSFANFANEDQTAKLTALMKRAAKAGYNGMLVCDVKFEKFQLQPAEVMQRLKKFREDCTAEKMKFIAGVTPFGYCDM